MYDYLKYLGIKIKVVTTKADKVGKTLLFRHLKKIREKMQLEEAELIITSTQTKIGLDILRKLLK
jgi:GTP-binding protein EngB required for normal cell division